MTVSDYSNAVWSFETKRFLVTLEAEPETMDPADSFQFPEDIRMVRDGSVAWFCAVVRVYHRANPRHNWQAIGSDYLGGCAYKDVREFYTSHRDADPMNRNSSIMRAARGSNCCICHYFPSMVSEAIGAARTTLQAANQAEG